MDTYHIWCDLKDTTQDLEFSTSVKNYLDLLKAGKKIIDYRLARRKLGLGSAPLPEFHITIDVRDLAQLDAAFQHVATRRAPVEPLHKLVYGAVDNFMACLERDFPDPVRSSEAKR